MDSSGLRFGVLGALDVVRDGHRVPVVGPKLRVVLASLLVRANTTVTLERLAEDLWGECPPASARKAAQLHVVRLRRVVGATALETRTDGYRIRVEPDQLDLLRFRGLVERARVAEPADARALLAEALACWRGDPLADIASEALRRDTAAALAEERLAAHERFLQVSLDLGEHAVVLADLGALAREHPWRESLQALLVLALHRSGRQADALEAYRAVRRKLVDELGVEPGPLLRAAHAAALGGRGGMSRVDMLPPDPPGFVGREADLAALDAALAAGHRTLAVTGIGGVGKTALALRWAHRVRDRFPDGQLFVDLHGFSPESPVSAARALERCLRALGVSDARMPAALDERITLYRSLLDGRRVIVVLDNAADIDQVSPLLPPGPDCAALVTSRTALSVPPGAKACALDALTGQDARTLLTRLTNTVPADIELDELVRLCGGHPLALRVAAANLAPGGSAAEYLAALRADRLSALTVEGTPELAVCFSFSYRALREPERRLYRLLGRVPGPEFDIAAAVALAGSAERTRRLLDRLVAAGLLTRSGPDRYRVHDLVRAHAAERAREEELPGDLAAADIRLYDHYLGTAAAACARFSPMVRRFLPACPASGEEFTEEDAALRWLDAELPNLVAAAERAAGSAVLRRYCGGLADALRGYVAGRGCTEDGLALADAALRAAAEDDDQGAEIAGQALHGVIAYNASDYREAGARFARALDLCGQNQVAEAECRHGLGRVHSQLGQPREAMRHHERTLAIARQTGDEPIVAREMNYIGVALLSLGRVRSAVACHDKAVELSARLGGHVRLFALNGLGLAQWTAGRLREAAETHRECAELCLARGLRHFAATSLVCLAETLSDLGRYPEAEDTARRAMDLGRRVGERRHEAGVLEVLATAARRQGRLSEAVDGYHAALAIAADLSFRYGEVSTLVGLAAAHRASNRPAEAAAFAEQALATMAETGMRVLDCAARTELAAALLALGDRSAAAAQVARSLATAREDGQRLSEARALLVSASVHEAGGDTDGARRDRTAAETAFTDLGAPAVP